MQNLFQKYCLYYLLVDQVSWPDHLPHKRFKNMLGMVDYFCLWHYNIRDWLNGLKYMKDLKNGTWLTIKSKRISNCTTETVSRSYNFNGAHL